MTGKTCFGLFAILAASGCAEPPPAEPELQSGTITTKAFEPFHTGDYMFVNSVQIGLWMMPSVRFRGLEGHPEISCIALDLDKDIILAETTVQSGAIKHRNWMQLTRFSMEIKLPDDEINDYIEIKQYAGDRLLFECVSTDESGLVLSVSHEMILGGF